MPPAATVVVVVVVDVPTVVDVVGATVVLALGAVSVDGVGFARRLVVTPGSAPSVVVVGTADDPTDRPDRRQDTGRVGGLERIVGAEEHQTADDGDGDRRDRAGDGEAAAAPDDRRDHRRRPVGVEFGEFGLEVDPRLDLGAGGARQAPELVVHVVMHRRSPGRVGVAVCDGP